MNQTLREFYAESGMSIPENNEGMYEDIVWIRTCELKGSDWTQLPDSPLDDAKKLEWANYRTVMRDITKNLPSDLMDTFFPPRP